MSGFKCYENRYINERCYILRDETLCFICKSGYNQVNGRCILSSESLGATQTNTVTTTTNTTTNPTITNFEANNDFGFGSTTGSDFGFGSGTGSSTGNQ